MENDHYLNIPNYSSHSKQFGKKPLSSFRSERMGVKLFTSEPRTSVSELAPFRGSALGMISAALPSRQQSSFLTLLPTNGTKSRPPAGFLSFNP